MNKEESEGRKRPQAFLVCGTHFRPVTQHIKLDLDCSPLVVLVEHGQVGGKPFHERPGQVRFASSGASGHTHHKCAHTCPPRTRSKPFL